MLSSYSEVKQSISMTSQFHGPTMMIKSSILRDFGLVYRPYFKDNYEDTDLAYRIVQKYKAFNLSSFEYRYRILENSLCRKRVDIRNRNLYRVVVYLAKQREKYGEDCLDRDRPDIADRFFKKITRKYDKDRSLIHHEAASYFIYYDLYWRAIKEALHAIVKKPLSIRSYRLVFYCIRRYF